MLLHYLDELRLIFSEITRWLRQKINQVCTFRQTRKNIKNKIRYLSAKIKTKTQTDTDTSPHWKFIQEPVSRMFKQI